MKKLMFAAAVIAAGVAMADVSSANVVGLSFFKARKANENGGESDIGG